MHFSKALFSHHITGTDSMYCGTTQFKSGNIVTQITLVQKGPYNLTKAANVVCRNWR